MKKYLGIELGSTRIKAILADENAKVIASGLFEWENRYLPGGIWTYSLDDAVRGLQAAFGELKRSYAAQFHEKLTEIDALGISGMMHGYLPLDKNGKQIADFRTWRCMITAKAAVRLTRAFHFTIPQRWSVAHLYQRMLDRGAEVPRIARLHTLSSWTHSILSGEHTIGLGEASGMFPIDPATLKYNETMLAEFDLLASKFKLPWKIRDILPRPLPAGSIAGYLTESGARLLDPEGDLKAGAPMAPPEGDVQTGMVATGTVRPGTANVSAGTSIFMVTVLKKPLTSNNPVINFQSSPSGATAAMCNANTCTSDLNEWVKLLGGNFDALFRESLKGEPDCGGVVTVPYLAGEPAVHMDKGVPLVVRRPDSVLSLPNFMRANIYSAFTTLRIGLDVLFKGGLKLDSVTGHGGLFKTKGIAQQYLADALETPVKCLSTAGEGGAWGIALLASFTAVRQMKGNEDLKLEDYLDDTAFRNSDGSTLYPDERGVRGFKSYLKNFKKAIKGVRAICGS